MSAKHFILAISFYSFTHSYYLSFPTFILHYPYTFILKSIMLRISLIYSFRHIHSSFVLPIIFIHKSTMLRVPTLIIRYIYTFSYLNLQSTFNFRHNYLLLHKSIVVRVFIYSLRNTYINSSSYICSPTWFHDATYIYFFYIYGFLCVFTIVNHAFLFSF